MSKAQRRTPATGRGQALTELRRSGAAGTHGRRRPDRRNTRRRAIAASMAGE